MLSLLVMSYKNLLEWKETFSKMKMKNLRGGAPRQKFFQQDWQLNVNQDEVEVHAMSCKIGTLEQELVAVKEQNADMSAQLCVLAL